MALLVALGYFNGFINFAVPQRACHCRSKLPRLLASRVKGHVAVNHHAERPARHDEKDDDYAAGYPTHRFPKRVRIPLRRRLLQEPSGGGRNVSYQVWCCMSYKHELRSSSESFLSNLRIYGSKIAWAE